MTKAIKRMILIFATAMTFISIACSETPGDAAIKAIPANPTEPAALRRQPTEVPWIPDGYGE